MFKSARRLTMLAMLGGSVAVPYLVATGKGIDSIKQWWNGSGGAPFIADPLAPPEANFDPLTMVTLPGERPVSRECAPPQKLGDVFRFDVTIDWIMVQWPTVTTVAMDSNLYGYRVPLLSGIHENDVAGCLTYYFGPDRLLQKITFEGTTGDADKLIKEVATPHGLTQRRASEPGLFMYQGYEGGKSADELKIRPNEVLRASSPHRRFTVSLVLHRPKQGWF